MHRGAQSGRPRRPAATVAALVACLLALLLPVAADAQGTQLGPNLNQYQANVNFGCETSPAPPWIPTGFETCTFLPTAARYRLAVPDPGVITQVAIKTGAPPMGPMRVTVARQLGDTNVGLACCFFAGQSGVLRPQPNRINRFQVRLPVTAFTDIAARQTVVDFLALTVMGAPIRIPGQIPGNDGLEGSLGYFPHLGASPEDRSMGRPTGYGNQLVPLMQARWVPLCGGGRAAASASSAEAKSAAGRCFGGVTAQRGSLRGNSARITLDCNLTNRCRGRLDLQRARGKAKTLGSARFRTGSGSRKTVKVKLNKAGKRAVRGRKAVQVRVKAKVAGGPNERTRLKLKR